eukprot:3114952-Rhodomonas_salina.1
MALGFARWVVACHAEKVVSLTHHAFVIPAAGRNVLEAPDVIQIIFIHHVESWNVDSASQVGPLKGPPASCSLERAAPQRTEDAAQIHCRLIQTARVTRPRGSCG